MRFVSHIVAAFLSCFLLPASSQQTTPAPPLAQRPAAEAKTGAPVTLGVVVTDKSGKPVSGLQKSDFTVLDDNHPETITSFQAMGERDSADPPTQVFLLMDGVNIDYQHVMQQREELVRYLRQAGAKLPEPTSLIILSDTTTQIQPAPTEDGSVLIGLMDSSQSALRSIGRSQGFYGGVDRLQLSLDALGQLVSREAQQPGRKLLIWLSSGWPLLTGPNVELTQKDQAALFNIVVRMSTALREARVTVYSVDPLGMSDAGGFRTFYYQSFLKGVTSASQMQNGNLGLQVIAVQTGGLVLNSTNDVAKSIATCMDDAKAFYTLTFNSPPADHPNEYHSLQVKVDKPKLTARTRTGYYAQP